MKVLLCIALLVVAQSMGFSVPKSEVDWDNLYVRWADGSLGPNDPVLRNHQSPKGFSEANERIINGNEAVPHAYPWAAALFMAGGSFCTGTVIGDPAGTTIQWILTAAHCQEGTIVRYTDVYLGAHNVRLSATEDDNRLEIRATEKFIHPNWTSSVLRGDVALIKLPEPITIVKGKIEPLLMVDASYNHEENIGADCLIQGWGYPKDTPASISPVLKSGTVQIISDATCQLTYGNIIGNGKLCTTGGGAVGSGKDGVCSGDSGSALSTTVNGVRRQIGVTSFVSSAGCESGNPDGFARVAAYRDWIRETSGI